MLVKAEKALMMRILNLVVKDQKTMMELIAADHNLEVAKVHHWTVKVPMIPEEVQGWDQDLVQEMILMMTENLQMTICLAEKALMEMVPQEEQDQVLIMIRHAKDQEMDLEGKVLMMAFLKLI